MVWQLCAAEMLSEFASAHGQRPSVMELPPGTGEQPAGPPTAPVPRAYHLNQGLLERSGAVQQVRGTPPLPWLTGCSCLLARKAF